MIRILLSATWLTPAIVIKDDTLTNVSSGSMAEGSASNDGRFWYEYAYTGTPWDDYLIAIDAGIAIEDPELRYFEFWTTEEYSPANIASAVRTNLATELARLDVAISTRMATFSYTAPDNSSITAIKNKTDQLLFTATNLHTVAKVVEDKTGYAITVWERTAIATAVEAAILNEWDGQAILNAIVWAIGNTNVSEVALVAAIRADLERAWGAIKAIPTNPLLTDDTRLDHLDADISSRAVPGDVSIQLTSSANAPQPIIISV